MAEYFFGLSADDRREALEDEPTMTSCRAPSHYDIHFSMVASSSATCAHTCSK